MSKLANVNADDIRDAIRLGCRAMCNVFNADDEDRPFFESLVRPVARFRFNNMFSEAHVPGRHLNALLSAQAIAGVEVDEACIEKQARAAFFSYSGALPFPLNRQVVGGDLINFAPHNLREGLHALYALARYRDSAQARAVAEASISAINRLWSPDSEWDRAEIERLGLRIMDFDSGPFITGPARAIGPLVKYYRATGYAPALELALRLKEKTVGEFFKPDGAYDRPTFGNHTHSTTCTMSGLAQLAELSGDAELLGRVKAFFDNGLWQIRDMLGWVIENSRDAAWPDRGEVNNTGDVLETALILGAWGYSQYYGDAERILRGHLLPSQLRDISFIAAPDPKTSGDGVRDVANRHLGAFGFPSPYGHDSLEADHISFNLDIVGGAVGSLCEALRHVATRNSAGHYVNLLFDHENEAISIESPYTHDHLAVTVKEAAPLFVRIPAWVDRATLKVARVDEPLISNGYLFIAEPPVNQRIEIEFGLTEQEITLKHRTRDIRVRLRGDQVAAMDNFGNDFTYFDPID